MPFLLLASSPNQMPSLQSHPSNQPGNVTASHIRHLASPTPTASQKMSAKEGYSWKLLSKPERDLAHRAENKLLFVCWAVIQPLSLLGTTRNPAGNQHNEELVNGGFVSVGRGEEMSVWRIKSTRVFSQWCDFMQQSFPASIQSHTDILVCNFSQ